MRILAREGNRLLPARLGAFSAQCWIGQDRGGKVAGRGVLPQLREGQFHARREWHELGLRRDTGAAARPSGRRTQPQAAQRPCPRRGFRKYPDRAVRFFHGSPGGPGRSGGRFGMRWRSGRRRQSLAKRPKPSAAAIRASARRLLPAPDGPRMSTPASPITTALACR